MFRFVVRPNDDPNVIDVAFAGNLPDKYRQHFKLFSEQYFLLNSLVDFPELDNQLLDAENRVCRFCKKSFPSVRFNSIAHKIPESLGNKALLSDFECDRCNKYFATLESDLCYFLGISRTILAIKGKSGVPEYTSPGKVLTVKKEKTEFGKATVITVNNEDFGRSITWDAENRSIRLTAKLHSFRPLNVYKVLLKIALSSLPEDRVDAYTQAFKLLLSKKFQGKENNSFFSTVRYFVPGIQFPSPMVLLFEKKNPSFQGCTHIACIYFMHHVFQIWLPAHANDLWMYDGKTKMDFMVAPPFIDKAIVEEFGYPEKTRMDLSSKELRTDEPQIMEFGFDKMHHLEARRPPLTNRSYNLANAKVLYFS
jgi:hypothetical protein